MLKNKFISVCDIKAYRRNGDISPLILKFGTVLRRVFNCRSRPLYTLEKENSWNYWTVGWVSSGEFLMVLEKRQSVAP